MKHYSLIIFLVLTSIFIATPSFAGWLIYHKPAFSGRIIAADTKTPIEGAVVVAIYKTEPIISGPGGKSSSIIKVREALTDAKGEFFIPSYTTLIQPLSLGYRVDFIIYKPGYRSYPSSMFPFEFVGPEYLFSKEPLGTKKEITSRARRLQSHSALSNFHAHGQERRD